MFEDIIDDLRNKRKVILVHGNADMDAFGSAYAICKGFGNGDIFAPTGIDRVSRVVSEKLNISVLEECDLADYDMVIAADTSSPEQLGTDIEIPKDVIVIDHHHDNGKWDGYRKYIDDSKISCTQIMLSLLKEADVEITRDIGLMLLGGMLTDSAHFQFADPAMLRDFAYVLEKAGIAMDEVMDLTKNDQSMSERVASMKCIQRSRFERIGDMIVAVSYGGSYEATGCKSLMNAGADVAFVASQRDENFRLSGRATQEMVRRGINLGEIVKDIGMETDNDGGGHDGAAGISGVGDIEAMLHICMQRTMDEFRKIKKTPGDD